MPVIAILPCKITFCFIKIAMWNIIFLTVAKIECNSSKINVHAQNTFNTSGKLKVDSL